MKTCTKCKIEKPISEFSKDLQKKDGLRSDCKKCRSVTAAVYRSANPAKDRAATAAWRTINPDKIRAAGITYRAANSDKIRAASAAYRAANPEKCRIFKQNRRARKRANGGKLLHGLAEKLFKLQRGKCACCNLPLGDNYHLDHIMPLALGGANIDSNIQLLRAKCNMQKQAKHPVDFMQQKGFLL